MFQEAVRGGQQHARVWKGIAASYKGQDIGCQGMKGCYNEMDRARKSVARLWRDIGANCTAQVKSTACLLQDEAGELNEEERV